MRPVCSAAQSRALDAQLIEGFGVPGVALMEVAARGLATAVRERFAHDAARGVVVVCGAGNNGGDGYAAARWLKGWGLDVRTVAVGGAPRGDALVMQRSAAAAGVPAVDQLGDCGVIVDAVFGTGLSRDVVGDAARWVKAINSHPASVVAADLPSGVHADTGAVLGVAVRAQHTVSFGTHKLAHFTPTGRAQCGTVEVVDIGAAPLCERPSAVVVEAADVASWWPRRGRNAYKTRSGHLVVVAGSAAMAGAAVLCCRGALAAGVGLVTLVAPRGARSRLTSLAPEVMVREGGLGDTLEGLDGSLLAGATAVACGPGLGGGEPLGAELHRSLSALWRESALPMVFDADALVACGATRAVAPRVLTPHAGEAARLLGSASVEVQASRFASASALTSRGGTALLKGPNTLVATAGQPTHINTTGSPLLATGGSGDVLTSVVGALLAQGLDAPSAASAGAYVHGLAADLVGETQRFGVTASHIADAVPRAVERLLTTTPPSLP